MKLAVVGAGAMGRGIAQVSAVGGHEVMVYDAHSEALSTLHERLSESFQESVKRGKISAQEAQSALSRVDVAYNLTDLAEAELVIEAVVEDLDVKRDVFAQLENVVSADCILASNTSSLAIGAIAHGMADRERLIGLHFFNPVQAMKLVEIVIRDETADSIKHAAKHFVDSISKTGIPVRDTPGFLVNMAGRAYVTEALAILDENVATVDQIDRVARSVLGFPLGPFELMDLTGMDVNLPVTANIFEANFGDSKLRSTWYHRYLFDVGLLGKKAQGGFYRYEDDSSDEGQHSLPETSSLTLKVFAYDQRLVPLVDAAGLTYTSNTEEADLIIVAPVGLDVSSYCVQEGLDPTRTVGIDAFFGNMDLVTLMVPPGVSPDLVQQLSSAFRSTSTVETINDSPGFIAQRLLAAVVNLGCEIARRGVATPQDIDTAVRLGLRYPHGPLEWADLCGPGRILDVLNGLYETTGDHRYMPSMWLKRRVLAGISTLQSDAIPAAHRTLRPRAAQKL